MIELLTKTGCSQCVTGKAALDAAGIEYTTKVLNVDFDRHSLVEKFPQARQFPVFVIDNSFAGGYTEILKYVESKKE